MITIKEIQIKFPKWWQTAIIILVILIALKIDKERVWEILKLLFDKFIDG